MAVRRHWRTWSISNNGGRVNPDDPLTPFLSGGIRPLNLSDQQKQDLVEFLKALTSPGIAAKVTSTEIAD